MIQIPSWCRECPFYYPGMTAEDYLYLQYCMRANNNSKIVLDIQRGEIELSPLSLRTKKEVFDLFNADINYKFDVDLMC